MGLGLGLELELGLLVLEKAPHWIGRPTYRLARVGARVRVIGLALGLGLGSASTPTPLNRPAHPLVRVRARVPFEIGFRIFPLAALTLTLT